MTEGLKPTDFYLGGSILETVMAAAHPVTAGMPAKAAVFSDGSPVFETGEGFKGTILARYAAEGSPLLSGLLIGENSVQNKAAALDVEFGKGHIVLFGFCPQWRAQPFGTFRMVFNACLFGRLPSGLISGLTPIRSSGNRPDWRRRPGRSERR